MTYQILPKNIIEVVMDEIEFMRNLGDCSGNEHRLIEGLEEADYFRSRGNIVELFNKNVSPVVEMVSIGNVESKGTEMEKHLIPAKLCSMRMSQKEAMPIPIRISCSEHGTRKLSSKSDSHQTQF